MLLICNNQVLMLAKIKKYKLILEENYYKLSKKKIFC